MPNIEDLKRMQERMEEPANKEKNPLDYFRGIIDTIANTAISGTPGIEALKGVKSDELTEEDRQLYEKFQAGKVELSELETRIGSDNSVSESQKQLASYMREQFLERMRQR